MKKREQMEMREALANIKPIPGFDSQKWLRKVRAKILRDIEGMTSKEECEYFNQASERAERRRAERAT
ncbi:MAG: hypothetical protein LBI05_09785 [Planctomycetaceae bacterium]|jgi:hypothetical protein|nr:hypothetical protein [Planctomycetaceae bacterium]